MGSKVYIPAVHAQLTTREVLVSEWIEGKQLAKSEPDVINRLTPVGVECFLTQLLETGTTLISILKQESLAFYIPLRLNIGAIYHAYVHIFSLGRFHADPHPGNLLVTKTGRLALIDFGLCAEVPLPDTRNMTLAVVHLMQGNGCGISFCHRKIRNLFMCSSFQY